MDKNEIIQYLKKHQNELREMFGVIKIGLFGSYVNLEVMLQGIMKKTAI